MARDTDGRGTGRTLDRRSVLKGAAGVAGAGVLGVGAGAGSAGAVDTATVDDQFDLSASGRLEAIVVFDSRESMARLHDLDLSAGFHEYEVLPMTYTALTADQIRTVADWDGVRRVRKNEELEYYNDDSTEITGADAVQESLGYTGESVDVAVIDSGFSGPHPDFEGRIDSNWRWVDDPLGTKDASWVDLGPEADTDNLGHGTHCMGIIGGDGEASDGQFKGMAPDARLSMHMAGQTIYVSYAVGAWDHVLARKDDPGVDFDVDVVSNSYGVARDIDYNPSDPVNVASWEAFKRDVVVCFAAGNDGPGADTLSRFAKAPHVLCVGASRDDKHVTDFSSRGRTPDETRVTNYDRQTALRELWKYQASMTDGERRLDHGEFVGRLGPTGTGSAYHRIDTDERADALELVLDLTPDVDGQQVSVVVHEGSEDGEEVAKFGEEVFYQHRSITVDVEGGTPYWVELQPTTTVQVEYELEWETDEQFRGEPSNYGPVGVYRPALLAPGNSIVSTVGPTDPLDALAPDERPYYTPMSGTSMATPGCAGIAALVVDAARQNGVGFTAVDVITTLEATAHDVHTAYTPWNAGTGFVDAEAAVSRGAAGDWARFDDVSLVDPDTPTSLSVSGSRADDGSVFTGGQTNKVDVTVSSLSHNATVRDTVPAEWSVDAEHGDVTRVETDGDVKRVYLGSVSAGETPVTRTYFAEAPSGAAQTGTYTFGPAEANAPKTDDAWVAFGGTDSNAVEGEDTNA